MTDIARLNDLDPLKKPVNTLAIIPQNRKITALGRKAYNVMLNLAQSQGGREGYLQSALIRNRQWHRLRIQ